jgi:hypothetical protein
MANESINIDLLANIEALKQLEPKNIEFPTQTEKSEGNIIIERYTRFGGVVFPLTLLHPDPKKRDISVTIDIVFINLSQTENIDVSYNAAFDEIEFRKDKRLIKSRKTWHSTDDWKLSIQGAFFTDNPNDYPMEKVKTLLDIINVGIVEIENDNGVMVKETASIPVVSQFLQMFDIFEIVVINKSFPQMEALQNGQYFNIEALSNTPIELVTEI